MSNNLFKLAVFTLSSSFSGKSTLTIMVNEVDLSVTLNLGTESLGNMSGDTTIIPKYVGASGAATITSVKGFIESSLRTLEAEFISPVLHEFDARVKERNEACASC